MRRLLDRVYWGSGMVAAGFLVAIFLVVLSQVSANLLDFCIRQFTGKSLGLVVPSYAEIAGFFLAAASFFALPYTLRHGAHIRVTLVLMRLPRKAQTFLAVAACFGAACVSAYFSWYCWELVMESQEFGDLSSGLVPVPLWIPQLPLAIGSALLAVSLLDSGFRALSCRHDPATKLMTGEG